MPDFRIGPDQTIGDLQLRNAELSKLGFNRRRSVESSATPPDPAMLARQILSKAGYAEAELNPILPLVQTGNEAK
jgi:hypothetical protein